MTYDFVDVTRDGHLTIITIDRADAHNALNADTQLELVRAFDDFQNDENQWVGIVTGAGDKAFCAGMDLKQQAAVGGLFTPDTGFGGLTARFECAKPIIAAVNGIAMGGGFEIALACDVVVASSHATFALPEPRVGLAAMAGGMHRLPRAIGLTRAMGMLLTGRRVSAQEGRDMGFVNEVTDGPVLDLARKWADMMLACSPLALRATKQCVLEALDRSLPEAIGEQWELPHLKAMLASRDAIEGPKAFAEKRTPVWSGR